MSGSPITTEALRGRIGVPDEVRRFLRQQEAEVRRRLDELAPLGDEPGLAEARAELRAALEDARKSPLLRALRRRTTALEAGAPGRAALQSSMDGLFARATRAAERVGAAAAVREELARLHGRFAASHAWHLARGMERMRIPVDEARWPRDPASLRALAERIRLLEAELADRAAEVPPQLPDVLEMADWPESVALAELCGAIAEAEESARPHRPLAWRQQGRALGRAHVERLLGHGGEGGTSPEVAVARQALAVVDAGSVAGAEDVDAQLVLLRDAARRRAPALDGAPSAHASLAPGDPATGGLLFVVPLFGDFVLIRTGDPWPVRVDAAGVRVGKPAPCSAILPPGEAVTLVPPERWMPPLFDAPNVAAGEWLETAVQASVLPFARIAQDRWIGRIVSQGRLRPPGVSRWSAARPRRGKVVRALPSVAEADAEGVLEVGPILDRTDGPFGWTTLTVELPFADLPRGWVRTAESVAGRDHVEAEQAFLQAAGRLLPGCTPRCLGRSEEPRGYVYAPPLALAVEDSLALGAWRQEDPVAFVAAVARLWRRFTDAGVALGFYHDATLRFRVVPGTPGSRGRLEAVAVAAPLGTRLGVPYRRSGEVWDLFPRSDALDDLEGFAAQCSGETALPFTEARAVLVHCVGVLSGSAGGRAGRGEKAVRLREILDAALGGAADDEQLIRIVDRIAAL